MAIGQVGMSNEDFLNADFVTVMDAINGYNKQKESEIKTSWEQTRWLGAIMLQPHLGKGKSLKLTDLIRFEWEGDTKPIKRELSKEQLEWRRRMDEFMKKQSGIA
jgi:hypothetical protein